MEEESEGGEAPKDDDVVPLAKKAGRAMRARRGGRGAEKEEDEESV